MHRLEKKIREAREQKRIALIPFLTAGFPDPESFWNAITELDDAGADIIEIGVPFSDPVADGPVVEQASSRSLEAGINLDWILRGLKRRRSDIKAEIVLMGYLNPFLQYGYEDLCHNAASAGVAGFIVPDLPLDESGAFKQKLKEKDLALIPLIGPNTTKERMKAYAQDAEAYVYIVSVLGITGERKKLAANVGQIIDMAREAFDIPIALGFGLKEPSQLEILPKCSRPDGAVFGSALLSHLDKGLSARDFMKVWR